MCCTFEEAGDVFQLGDVVLPAVAVFGQQGQVLQVLPAGVGRVKLVQLSVHHPPGLHLLLGELHTGDGITTGTYKGEWSFVLTGD